MNLIDISIPLHQHTPAWPGSEPFHTKTYSDHPANSLLHTDLHFGTHVDAPRHFIKDGKTIDQVSLNRFAGPVYLHEYNGQGPITYDDLVYANIPDNTSKLLIKANQAIHSRQSSSDFDRNFIAFDQTASKWIVEQEIDLIGIDYLSIQQFDASNATHEILLKNEVVILEGLNLSEVESGSYFLICLPLKLHGVEASPVRAVLTTDRSFIEDDTDE